MAGSGGVGRPELPRWRGSQPPAFRFRSLPGNLPKVHASYLTYLGTNAKYLYFAHEALGHP